jgi:hypothetical protein
MLNRIDSGNENMAIEGVRCVVVIVVVATVCLCAAELNAEAAAFCP